MVGRNGKSVSLLIYTSGHHEILHRHSKPFPDPGGAGSGDPGRGNHQPVPDGPREHPRARCHPGALPADL